MGEKSIKFIKLFFRVFYNLVGIAIAGVIIISIAIPFNEDLNSDFSIIPANFSIAQKSVGEINTSNYESSVYIESATGLLKTVKPSLFISYGFLLFSLFQIIIIGIIIRQILLLIKSVQEKNVFTFENIKRIKIISFVLIGYEIFNLILSIVINTILSNYIYTDLIDTFYELGANFDIDNFAFPLLLLVISEIFRHGLKLQQEQDLTV